MSTRIYSSMECGCYYNDNGDDSWLYCDEHRRRLKKTNLSTRGFRGAFDAQKIEKRYWLYVLLCENGRYYIGITANKKPLNRILMHGDFMGARWTMKYKPVKIVRIQDIGFVTKVEAENQENDLTLSYMKAYGKQNVRGGRMTTTGYLFRKIKNPTKYSLLVSDISKTAIGIIVVIFYLWLFFFNNK